MYIIYSLEEGGDTQVVKLPSKEAAKTEFDNIIKRGHLDFRFGYREVKNKPFFLALAEDIETYNFVTKDHDTKKTSK